MKIQKINYSTFLIEDMTDPKVQDLRSWITINYLDCIIEENRTRGPFLSPHMVVSVMNFQKLNEFRKMLARKKLAGEVEVVDYERKYQ